MRKADIFFGARWEELADIEIGRAVKCIRIRTGSTDATARLLGWDNVDVERYVSHAPRRDDALDEHCLSLTPEDLRQKSIKRLEMMVKRAAARVLLAELGSIRAVARFVQKDSKYISWLLAPEGPHTDH